MPARPESEFPPSGCRWCGRDQRLHFGRWSDEAGWHTFTEPTRELIAERMRAKYAGRGLSAAGPNTDQQPGG